MGYQILLRIQGQEQINQILCLELHLDQIKNVSIESMENLLNMPIKYEFYLSLI